MHIDAISAENKLSLRSLISNRGSLNDLQWVTGKKSHHLTECGSSKKEIYLGQSNIGPANKGHILGIFGHIWCR